MSDSGFSARRLSHFTSLLIGTCLIVLMVSSPPSYSAPPAYASMQREQVLEYQMAAEDVMRIWVIYVGQGDGILIQLPSKYSYDPDPTDGDNDADKFPSITTS